MRKHCDNEVIDLVMRHLECCMCTLLMCQWLMDFIHIDFRELIYRWLVGVLQGSPQTQK